VEEKMDDRRLRALIEEYKATQDMMKHFDILRWQVGSVLIGAVAVVTGFAFYSTQASRWFPFLFFFSLILMATWIVLLEFCGRWNKQKIRRLHELEEHLDFHQHRYCRSVERKWYRIPAQWASYVLAVGIPILFLFMWLSYYGIIVIGIGFIVFLMLRKSNSKA